MKKYKIEDFTYCGAECYNVCYGVAICPRGGESVTLIHYSRAGCNNTALLHVVHDTVQTLDSIWFDLTEIEQCLLQNNINSTIPVYE